MGFQTEPNDSAFDNYKNIETPNAKNKSSLRARSSKGNKVSANNQSMDVKLKSIVQQFSRVHHNSQLIPDK
jgi:hypothetical protein